MPANRQHARMRNQDESFAGGGLRRIAIPDGWPAADLRLDREWLVGDLAQALLTTLRETIEWDTHRIRIFGREVDSPRLSCWIGDPGAAYTYSRTRFEPRPWPEALRPLRERLHAQLGVDFNSVLANRYRDGDDRMGWHSDDEPELGPRPVIASVSLGAPRRFLLKPRAATAAPGRGARENARPLTIELPPGSLLVMAGDTQRHYRHALPGTARTVGERINLTFRRIVNETA
jgi:alkylated DNA repair dioxygenase AlkB